ncbi:MAG: rhamnogalacturonan lyase [Planctomycetaceae bacterium]|nr:rhamnogalacturonan lyase [Planctomycetaceae bacterium]
MRCRVQYTIFQFLLFVLVPLFLFVFCPASIHSAEFLDRGVVALQTQDGVFTSWRVLPEDAGGEDGEGKGTVYTLLRDGRPIAFLDEQTGTNYLDPEGNSDSVYSVKFGTAADPGTVVSPEVKVWKDGFLTLTLDLPDAQTMPDGSVCRYRPNDMSCADLNGDGQYELIVKWDPSNSHDNAHDGYTGTTIFDAYTLKGEKLWRVDLGINIRSGAHYSPFLVYDFDGNGKAELVCKTADGTIDGQGKVLGNENADHRDKNGRVLNGPEFLTVFDGLTGEAVCTVNYPAPRTIRKMERSREGWGDDYGNRCDRFLACAASLDGKRVSAVFCRGYYTAAYVMAFDFDGENLKLRWFHRSETPGEGLYGEGNHSLAVGDLDRDGKDEIVFGAAALDDDGTLLYRTGLGHGDALHLFAESDAESDAEKLCVFSVHESKSAEYGMEVRSAEGRVLWGIQAGFDVGRGLAADIDPDHPGHEVWSSASDGVWSLDGKKLSGPTSSKRRPSMNFRIYWDGDLQDELFDRGVIDSWKNGRLENFGKRNHSATINGTKAVPALQADLLGDWREEVVLVNAEDPALIHIFSTAIPTLYRVNCLMTDHVYRMAIVWQNAGYNQPPHLGRPLIKMVQNGRFEKETSLPAALPANAGRSVR